MNQWKQKLRLRLPAIGLLTFTLLFWGFYDRYESDGPILLQSPSISDASRVSGDCVESDGSYVLRVVPGGPTARMNFRLAGGSDYEWIRVRGRMKVDGVVVGDYPWRCARLLLIQYDAGNKWIPGHHGVVAETGTKDWMECEDVFELDEKAAYVDLVIQQVGLEGVAEFDRLVAEPVRLRTSFAWWRIVFAGCWLAMGIVYFRHCRLDRRRLRRLILINALVIIVGTLVPGALIEDSAEYAREEAVRLVESAHRHVPTGEAPQKPAVPVKDEDKKLDRFNGLVGGVHGAGHFLLFASLCFLVYLSAALEHQHRSYFLKVAADILLFAAVTESLQYLTLDRTPGVKDWLIDAAGMLTAFLLFMLVLPMTPFRKRRRGSSIR